jgi:hypothetical protein
MLVPIEENAKPYDSIKELRKLKNFADFSQA